MAKCPYCKQSITLEKTKRESAESVEEVHKEVTGMIKKEIMYSCPHCESVLGFGFFMGGLLTGRPWNPDERMDAACALEVLGDKTAIPILEEALKQEKDKDVIAEITKTIATLKNQIKSQVLLPHDK